MHYRLGSTGTILAFVVAASALTGCKTTPTTFNHTRDVDEQKTRAAAAACVAALSKTTIFEVTSVDHIDALHFILQEPDNSVTRALSKIEIETPLRRTSTAVTFGSRTIEPYFDNLPESDKTFVKLILDCNNQAIAAHFKKWVDADNARFKKAEQVVERTNTCVDAINGKFTSDTVWEGDGTQPSGLKTILSLPTLGLTDDGYSGYFTIQPDSAVHFSESFSTTRYLTFTELMKDAFAGSQVCNHAERGIRLLCIQLLSHDGVTVEKQFAQSQLIVNYTVKGENVTRNTTATLPYDDNGNILGIVARNHIIRLGIMDESGPDARPINPKAYRLVDEAQQCQSSALRQSFGEPVQ